VFGAMNPNGYTANGHRRRAAVVAASALLAIAMLAVVGIDPGGLCALPAVALAILLALRRYPGERILAVMCEGNRERRRQRVSVSFAGRERVLPRGGLLLACALAVRPPPSASRAASLIPA
jgi:hypothetical protein